VLPDELRHGGACQVVPDQVLYLLLSQTLLKALQRSYSCARSRRLTVLSLMPERAASSCFAVPARKAAMSFTTMTGYCPAVTTDEQAAAVLRAFGARLRRERERRQLSQEAFAALMELDRTFYGALERGDRGCNIARLPAMSRGTRAVARGAPAVTVSPRFTGPCHPFGRILVSMPHPPRTPKP
jgi:DNA-binding XRE family transcriptional regulator